MGIASIRVVDRSFSRATGMRGLRWKSGAGASARSLYWKVLVICSNEIVLTDELDTNGPRPASGPRPVDGGPRPAGGPSPLDGDPRPSSGPMPVDGGCA